MENSQDRKFPSAFGTSPDDFLEQYESLIYKIIYEQTRENSRFEAEDLFQEFFIHIAENDFRRLRCFRGDSRPITYLGRILRNFLYDQYRKKGAKVSIDSLNEMEEEKNKPIPDTSLDLEGHLNREYIHEALKETFSKLSNRGKLIFDLSTNEEMTAKEISDLLGVKIKSVYKNNEKIKKNLKNELKKRGIEKF